MVIREETIGWKIWILLQEPLELGAKMDRRSAYSVYYMNKKKKRKEKLLTLTWCNVVSREVGQSGDLISGLGPAA